MMYKVATAFACFFALGQVAMADEHTMSEANQQNLTWEEFKASGANPRQFQSQRAPASIKIVCQSVETAWVLEEGPATSEENLGAEKGEANAEKGEANAEKGEANAEKGEANAEKALESNADSSENASEGGSITLNQSRRITAALLSDKYVVGAKQIAVEVEPAVFPCPRFKEVIRTYSLERAISYNEALAFKGSNLNEICLDLVNQDLNANAELQSEQDTGRVVDTCQVTGPNATSK